MNIASRNEDGELEATVQAGRTLMPKLIAAFPQCSVSWEAQLREWEGELVPYLDIGVFATFVEESLLSTGEAAEAKRAFDLLEALSSKATSLRETSLGQDSLKIWQILLHGAVKGMLRSLPCCLPHSQRFGGRSLPNGPEN